MHRLVRYKQDLDAGLLHGGTGAHDQWWRRSLGLCFGTARLPRRVQDALTQPANRHAMHVAVLVDNHVYRLPVTSAGMLHSPSDLADALLHIMHHAQAQPPAPAVPVLTSASRSLWAATRDRLASHPDNRTVTQMIDSSLFVLSLDRDAAGTDEGRMRQLTGLASSGHNRWSDKALNLVVNGAGHAGVVGEHSPVDAGVPAAIMADIVAEQLPALPPAQGQILQWEHLTFRVDETVASAISAGEREIQSVAADSSWCLVEFDDYGTDWMSAHRLPVDSFTQLALQLATKWAYALHGRTGPVPVYETASTRLFRHGRTETARALTGEMYELLCAMPALPTTQAGQYNLLPALKSHARVVRMACAGKGMDRHLSAMGWVWEPQDGPYPFSHPLFDQSRQFLLSTSGLLPGAADIFRGTGFGAMYPDGYGVNYLDSPKRLTFGVEAKRSSTLTDTALWTDCLYSALRLLRTVVEN